MIDLLKRSRRAGLRASRRGLTTGRKLVTAVMTGVCLLFAGVTWIALNDYFGHNRNPPEPVAVPSWPSKEVVVIGDSFTGGSDEGGNGQANWTEQVQSLLLSDPFIIEMRVIGLGGSGYVSGGSSDSTFVDAAESGVTQSSDVVLIFGSINDQNHLGEVAPAARAVYERVDEVAPDAQLIVVGPQIPYDEPTDRDMNIAKEVRNAARGYADVYVDPIAEDWFDDERIIGSDGVHPTDVGHELMAKRIAPALREALNRQ